MTVQPPGPDARERAILHDLHNQLAVISGSAELAADQLESGSPAHDRLQGILAAVRTGHDLLRELSLGAEFRHPGSGRGR